MTLQLRHAIVTAILTIVTASQVSPVAKVISLLEGMKADIVKEASSEAATYDKFACFCKDTTATKATSVTDGGDTIDKLSAAIAENTATKNAGETKVQGLKATKEALSKDLQDNTARCATEKAEYEALAADFNKAISSLKSAMKSMSDKQTAMGSVKAASALLDTGSAGSGLRETLQLADAMGLVKAPTQKAFLQGFSALLQQGTSVDPADSGYKYHSQDIVDLLQSLKKDFTEAKATLDTEHGKGATACTNIKKSLAGKIETNTKETKTTTEKNNRLGASIAEDRGSLVEAQDLMKDDEAYLKSLTGRCETRAGEWDQRSSLRASEIEAISTALKVLGDRVKPADETVNARVLLLTKKAAVAPKKAAVVADTKKAAVATPVATAKAAATPKATVTKATEPKVAPAAKAVPSFLQKVSAHSQGDLSAQEALAKEQAVDTIKNAGIHLKSPILTALAMQVAADPFKKVKQLIQGLVERLIRESAQEATKKGFCDTELGKARVDRTFRWTRVKKLGAGIQVLQAKEDQLTEELASLTSSLTVLDTAVKEDTKLRKEEKDENAKTLTTAREGLTAVNEALLLLRSFYKESAKAAFLQEAASPVDEDTAGAGFSGAYKGKQQSSNAVLALLETIASDFERTIRATENSEDVAAKEHVKFQRVTKSDIGGKATKKELNEQDLATTKNNLKVDRADMKTNMDLVDDAVKTLMELKPTCIDTGMSFKERTEKREEEVKALKNALCILDTEKVEGECK